MKISILKTLLLSLLVLTASASAETGNWHTSWDKASAESKRTGKPILMDFTGSDWCGWCIKLKSEVFDTKAFKTWAKKNVVLLELDFPRGTKLPEKIQEQNKELAQKYQVRGFPTIIFAKANGDKIGQYGYDKGGPEVWTRKASKMLK